MNTSVKLTKRGLLNVNAEERRDLCRKYGKVVDEVDFLPGGVCCDIYLNKDDMTFSAAISDEWYHDKDGSKVREWAYKQLKAISNLTWLPVISVLDVGENARGRDYQYNSRKLDLHEISLDIHRFYVAALVTGGIRAVEWHVHPEKRLTSHGTPSVWTSSNEEKLVIESGRVKPLHEDNIHILPYTEELWEGLQQLVKGIDTLQAKLHAMMKTEEGLLKIQGVGAGVLRLLEGPKKDEDQGLMKP